MDEGQLDKVKQCYQRTNQARNIPYLAFAKHGANTDRLSNTEPLETHLKEFRTCSSTPERKMLIN